jgi:secreted PhoX family phosphatase
MPDNLMFDNNYGKLFIGEDSDGPSSTFAGKHQNDILWMYNPNNGTICKYGCTECFHSHSGF